MSAARSGWAVVALVAMCVGAVRAGDPEARAVAFQSDDGVLLSADYYAPQSARPPAPFVILLHGFEGARRDGRALVQPLHAAGFAVLALDLRGHGASATPRTRERVHNRDAAVFDEMQLDLRAAYDWLATQPEIDRARFALVGADLGAALALRYAALDRSVDAMVCVSPRWSDFGLDGPSEMAKIKGRGVLLIVSEDAADRRAADELEKSGSGATRVNASGTARGAELIERSSDLPRRIVDFVRKAVGEPTNAVVVGSIHSAIYHERGSGWAERIAPTNLRCYSSPHEAEARGVRRSRSAGPDAGSAQSAPAAPPNEPNRPAKRPKKP